MEYSQIQYPSYMVLDGGDLGTFMGNKNPAESHVWHFNHHELTFLNNAIIMMRNKIAEYEHRTGGDILNKLKQRKDELQWLNIKIFKYIKKEETSQTFTTDEQVLLYDIAKETSNFFLKMSEELYFSFGDPVKYSDDDEKKEEQIAKNLMFLGTEGLNEIMTNDKIWLLCRAVTNTRKKLEKIGNSLDGLASETVKQKADELAEISHKLTALI